MFLLCSIMPWQGIIEQSKNILFIRFLNIVAVRQSPQVIKS
jgi:hypothetical protein